jgi:hypothetical protein
VSVYFAIPVKHVPPILDIVSRIEVLCPSLPLTPKEDDPSRHFGTRVALAALVLLMVHPDRSEAQLPPGFNPQMNVSMPMMGMSLSGGFVGMGGIGGMMGGMGMGGMAGNKMMGFNGVRGI